MGNEKLKRLLPLLVLEQPTTTKEGIAEYRRVRRLLDKLEKENPFQFDRSLEEIDQEIKKHLNKMGLVQI